MLARLVAWLSIRLWRFGTVLNWAAGLPWVGRWLQPFLFDPATSQAILIPVHETVQAGQSVVLPNIVLPGLIERASHRTVLNRCLCREGEGCRTHPVDLGCLFLGDGAARIDPALGHGVDAGKALDHVQRAMQRGLMPTVLHSSLDAFMLQIPYRRMLAICFCCDCCCTIRKSMRIGSPLLEEVVLPLPGLSVEVGDRCTGCRTCIAVCPSGAIALVDGCAVIGDTCRGCGHCATVCPAAAITLRIDDRIDPAARLRDLIETRTQIGGGT